MSIQMPGLFRKELPQGSGVAAQEYRKALANELAQYDPRRDELAPKYEAEIVEISSLQSEGNFKRDPWGINAKGASEGEYPKLQKELMADTSALPRLAHGNFDEESCAVLRDVKREIEKLDPGDHEYFLTPANQVGQDTMAVAQALRLDDQGYIAGGFNVAIHDTPGLDNGLLLIAPISNRELQQSGEYLRIDVLSRKTASLNEIESGYQFHDFNAVKR